mgnify:FL=1
MGSYKKAFEAKKFYYCGTTPETLSPVQSRKSSESGSPLKKHFARSVSPINNSEYTTLEGGASISTSRENSRGNFGIVLRNYEEMLERRSKEISRLIQRVQEQDQSIKELKNYVKTKETPHYKSKTNKRTTSPFESWTKPSQVPSSLQQVSKKNNLFIDQSPSAATQHLLTDSRRLNFGKVAGYYLSSKPNSKVHRLASLGMRKRLKYPGKCN